MLSQRPSKGLRMGDPVPLTPQIEQLRAALTANEEALKYKPRADNYNGMDESDRAYIDAKSEAVRAQNDARFAEVIATLKTIQETSMKRRDIWGAAAATILSIVGIILAALSIGGDRFDGGMAASGVVSTVLNEQKARDQAQDQRLTEILDRLDAVTGRLDAQPASPAISADPSATTSGN